MDFSAISSSLMQMFDIQVLGWLFLGVLVGIIFGAIPGLTATTAIALFTPMTFGLNFNSAFSFLLAIFCGGLYAGSIPAILIKTPGAPGNAATILDGYPMARSGRAGEALFHSVFSSWIGGTFSALALLFFAPAIAKLALQFGPQEYFSVSLFGLSCIAGLSGKSLAKGIAGGVLGMLFGTVGLDPIDGMSRFTFGQVNLLRGIEIVPALVGLFAVTEVLLKANTIGKEEIVNIPQISLKLVNILSYIRLYWHKKILVFKSAVIGTIVGAIPGTGASTASWISYNEARRTTKHPEEFGNGSVDGLISSETANNAISGGSLIPLLTLGIPGDTATAVLLGALTIQGLIPGPMMLVEHFDILALMLWMLMLGNLFMLIFGVWGSKYFPKILSIPQQILMPIILVLCVTGSYAVANSFFDVQIALILGILGFIMVKYEFPLAPLVLGLILGPIMEPNFRRALVANQMNPMIFITSPISLFFLLLTLFTAVMVYRRAKKSPAK
jgi:putative tricarboxylic transport membrane protein